nr:PKD domain-containing protein [uncultured Fluviicola sp.]
MKKWLLFVMILNVFFDQIDAQMNATFSKTVNTNCNGNPCNNNGPTILINELMVTPNSYDGCISTDGTGIFLNCAEWIELYNPNLCQTDISCYYLGNSSVEGAGALRLPVGTLIPPGGFCIIRGAEAAAVPSNLLVQNGGNTVEIIVTHTYPGICNSNGRFWLPNQGGWLAVYDDSGIAQDAFAWGTGAMIADQPCIPTAGNGCTAPTALSSFVNIPANRKEELLIAAAPVNGITYARMVDGGTWDNVLHSPTYGTCNAACQQPVGVMCTGSATINVTGGMIPYSFAWSGPVQQTTQTAVGLCEGTYTCQVTDGAGTVQLFTVTIEDFEPVLNFSVQDEFCLNDPAVTLLATPVPVGQATGVFSGNGVSGNIFGPQIAGAGISGITYTYVDEMGCNNSITETVTIHALPAVNLINIESPYCVAIQNANIQGIPAGGQLNGQGVSQNQFHPAQAGPGTFNLTYQYEDINGCANSVTTVVEVVSEAPDAEITVPTDLCIDANPVNIQVNPAGGQIQIDGANAGFNFSPQIYGVGVHNLSYSYTNGDGCAGTGNATIEVHELPIVSMNLENVYCSGAEFIPLVPQPAGGILSGNNVIGGQLNLDQAQPGVYTIRYEFTDQFGCFNFMEGTYILSEEITPGFDFVLDCTRKLDVDADPKNTTYTYDWNFGGMEETGGPLNSFQFGNPGSYPVILTITDTLGCSHDVTHTIEIPYSDLLAFQIVTNPVTVGSPVLFQNLLQMENVTYEWDFGDGTILQGVLHPNHIYQNPGAYLVLLTATDTNGCKYTTWRTLVIPEEAYIYIPNTFTPDGNEYNNYFEAQTTGISEFEIRIFNRWGEAFFYSTDPHFQWDGTYKGERCPDGMYNYEVIYTPLNGLRNRIVGHVNLLR